MSSDHGRDTGLIQEVGRLRSRIRELEQVFRQQGLTMVDAHDRDRSLDAQCPLPDQSLGPDGQLMEASLRLSNQIHQAGQHHGTPHEVCRDAVHEIRALFQCECVGIRLLDDQGNIPYEAYEGFPESFYHKESPLSVERDHCMCIEVIKGQLDRSLSFVTTGGSFFMNGTTEFLSTVSEADRGQTRNVCNQYGYESVALIPIRDRESILGLIHVADTRVNRVPEDRVRCAETVALQLATVIKYLRIETELRRQEEAYRNLVDHSLQGLVIVQDYRIVFANQAMADMLGYTIEELLTQAADYMTFLVHPDDRARMNTYYQDRLAARAVPSRYKIRVLNKGGEIRHVELFISRVDSRGGPVIQAACIDITEHQIAQEALARSEEKYRTLFENMAQGVFYQQADGTLVDCNPAALEMFGLTRDEFLSRDSLKPQWQVIREDGSDLPGDQHASMVALRTGQPVRDVVVGVYNPRKRDVWLQINAIPQFRPGQDTPYQVFVTLHDITVLKGMEQALIDEQRRVLSSEQQFRELARLSPAGIYRTDVQGHCVYVNECWCRMAGLSQEEAMGDGWIQALHPSDRDQVSKEWYAHGIDDRPWHLRYRFVDGQGEVTWIYGTAVTLTDENGIITGYLGVNTDITQLHEAEDELKRNEQRMRTLIDNLPNGAVILFDRELRCLEAGGQGLAPAGLSTVSMVGRSIFEIFPPETCQLIEPDYRVALAGDTTISEVPYQGRMYLTQTIPVCNEQGIVTAGMVMMQDITDRKEAELRMARHLDELRRWHTLTLGRETRILELKREVNELLACLGQAPRYGSVTLADERSSS